MADAVTAVNGGMSLLKASAEFGVPKSTLSDRVTGCVKPGSVWGKKTKLSTTDESALLMAATTCAKKGIGFSKGTFLRYVSIFAEERGLNFKRNKPSDMWWHSLKARHHNFSLRSHKHTAANRHSAMTRERIRQYGVGSLKEVMDLNNFHEHPEKIWTMDEPGIQTAHKPPKVTAAKGPKTVHGLASISRETITVIACRNAVGLSVPPYFIVPGKTSKKLHGFDIEPCTDPTSPLHGAKFSVSESGWTKEGIGRLWFKEHFLSNIGHVHPQVLIFDGRELNNNTEFIKIAREENIILGELPSHTSNWTQPFNRAVLKSLKNSWNNHVDNFVKSTGISLGHSSFLRVFGKAWEESVTGSNITSGFRATGIFPFDPTVIPDVAYAPNKSDGETQNTQVDMVDQGSSVNFPETSCSGGEAESAIEIGAENMTELSSPSSVSATLDTDFIATPVDILTGETADLPFLNLLMSSTENVDIPVPLMTDCMTEVPCSEMEEVTDAKALEVIKSSLNPDTLAKYCAAYISGMTLNDGIYATWDMYKTRCTPLSAKEHFPVPTKTVTKIKKINVKDKYFVISADEVYKEKVLKEEEKKLKSPYERIHTQERERKKQMKHKNGNAKQK